MGGVKAISQLLSSLPAQFPAGICVVQHISKSVPTDLARLLSGYSKLKVKTATDDEVFKQGWVYVAPADQHLLIKGDGLRVVRGPRENRVRPAIDPLFRSAAVRYGPRVIGVLLTGFQNDGSSGLVAIKRCGGLAVIQSPEDAAYGEMPSHALKAVDSDYCLPLSEIAECLKTLVSQDVAENSTIPKEVKLEAEIAERVMTALAKEERLAHQAPIACPECGAALWPVQNAKEKGYRCLAGHSYTTQSLLLDHSEVVEKALWLALRTLEERGTMLDSMASDERARGHMKLSHSYKDRANEAKKYARSVRFVLLSEREAA